MATNNERFKLPANRQHWDFSLFEILTTVLKYKSTTTVILTSSNYMQTFLTTGKIFENVFDKFLFQPFAKGPSLQLRMNISVMSQKTFTFWDCKKYKIFFLRTFLTVFCFFSKLKYDCLFKILVLKTNEKHYLL